MSWQWSPFKLACLRPFACLSYSSSRIWNCPLGWQWRASRKLWYSLCHQGSRNQQTQRTLQGLCAFLSSGQEASWLIRKGGKIKWRGKRTVVNSKNKVSKNRLGIVMAETRNEWCLLWKKHYRQLSGTACAWLQKIPFPATPVKVLRWTVMWHTVSWGLGELLPDLNGQFLPRYAISLSKHKALYNVQD